MKLKEINAEGISTGLNTINLSQDEKNLVIATMKNLRLQNYLREIKAPFDELENNIPQNLVDFGHNYVLINLQKIKYLCESAQNEFLATESTTVDDSQATNELSAEDYNVNFYGGTGQTAKDTSSNRQTSSGNSKQTSISNIRKTQNFYTMTNNSMFRFFFNLICETFTEGVSG